MKTPERAAALLVQGPLDRTAWRQFEREEFNAKVKERLDGVDLELVAAGGRWIARPRTPGAGADEDFHPIFHLHSVEQAMVAVLYLHLRYLPEHTTVPTEHGGNGRRDEPSVDVDDLIRPFIENGSYKKTYLEGAVLGHLKRCGFCEQRNGRYYAGPYLAAVDPVIAGERAKAALDDFLIRQHLRRRAAELETQHHPDTAPRHETSPVVAQGRELGSSSNTEIGSDGDGARDSAITNGQEAETSSAAD